MIVNRLLGDSTARETSSKQIGNPDSLVDMTEMDQNSMPEASRNRHLYSMASLQPRNSNLGFNLPSSQGIRYRRRIMHASEGLGTR
jgi:hypothetical protein